MPCTFSNVPKTKPGHVNGHHQELIIVTSTQAFPLSDHVTKLASLGRSTTPEKTM